MFVDSKRTMRQERADMFLALREGDVLFMFARGDLGFGRELRDLRERLDQMGVSIEYPPVAPDGRGRPAKFNPSPEDDAYIKIFWKDQRFSLAYCLRKASERTGVDVKRHQLIYRYGKRSR